jgi:hypothetical protein
MDWSMASDLHQADGRIAPDGRTGVVLYPVFKGSSERGDGMESDVANTSSTRRNHVIMCAKDASRAIDYAETHPDLDCLGPARYLLRTRSGLGQPLERPSRDG